LSSYFLAVELEQPSRRGRIGYVLTSSLAVYAHYLAALVLLVHFGTVVAMKRRAAFKREWLGVAMAILLLCSPGVIVAYPAVAERHCACPGRSRRRQPALAGRPAGRWLLCDRGRRPGASVLASRVRGGLAGGARRADLCGFARAADVPRPIPYHLRARARPVRHCRDREAPPPGAGWIVRSAAGLAIGDSSLRFLRP